MEQSIARIYELEHHLQTLWITLTKKKYYSLVVQGVVNTEKKFTDVFCGEPGSLHDSRVLRRSNLYRRTLDNENQQFPHNTFLIGDAAYPLLNWLIPPFKNYRGIGLTEEQINFNKLLSSTRMIVENAFQRLKMRFRRLAHFTEQFHIHAIVNIIASVCVVHNICIDHDDNFEDPEDNDNGNSEDENDNGNGNENDSYHNNENEVHYVGRRAALMNEINNRV